VVQEPVERGREPVRQETDVEAEVAGGAVGLSTRRPPEQRLWSG
jgi:hypothetical protein